VSRALPPSLLELAAASGLEEEIVLNSSPPSHKFCLDGRAAPFAVSRGNLPSIPSGYRDRLGPSTAFCPHARAFDSSDLCGD